MDPCAVSKSGNFFLHQHRMVVTVQDLYLSFPRQTDAELTAKAGPINYCGIKPGVSVSLSNPHTCSLGNGLYIV